MEINKLYTDPSREGSFSGLSGFKRSIQKLKIKTSDLKNYFKSLEAYTLHKPKRKKFIRKKVISPSIDYYWNSDLMDVSKIKDENDGFTFLLTVPT